MNASPLQSNVSRRAFLSACGALAWVPAAGFANTVSTPRVALFINPRLPESAVFRTGCVRASVIPWDLAAPVSICADIERRVHVGERVFGWGTEADAFIAAQLLSSPRQRVEVIGRHRYADGRWLHRVRLDAPLESRLAVAGWPAELARGLSETALGRRFRQVTGGRAVMEGSPKAIAAWAVIAS